MSYLCIISDANSWSCHSETLEVQIDDTAKLFNTERRRIYDIVNVFEAVQIMSKVGKNVYNWHGRTFLIQSLAWLHQIGIKLNIPEQYRSAKDQERDMNDIENMSPLQSPRLVSPGLSPMISPGLSPYLNSMSMILVLFRYGDRPGDGVWESRRKNF